MRKAPIRPPPIPACSTPPHDPPAMDENRLLPTRPRRHRRPTPPPLTAAPQATATARPSASTTARLLPQPPPPTRQPATAPSPSTDPQTAGSPGARPRATCTRHRANPSPPPAGCAKVEALPARPRPASTAEANPRPTTQAAGPCPGCPRPTLTSRPASAPRQAATDQPCTPHGRPMLRRLRPLSPNWHGTSPLPRMRYRAPQPPSRHGEPRRHERARSTQLAHGHRSLLWSARLTNGTASHAAAAAHSGAETHAHADPHAAPAAADPARSARRTAAQAVASAPTGPLPPAVVPANRSIGAGVPPHRHVAPSPGNTQGSRAACWARLLLGDDRAPDDTRRWGHPAGNVGTSERTRRCAEPDHAMPARSKPCSRHEPNLVRAPPLRLDRCSRDYSSPPTRRQPTRAPECNGHAGRSPVWSPSPPSCSRGHASRPRLTTTTAPTNAPTNAEETAR